jgi:hypothetical protein
MKRIACSLVLLLAATLAHAQPTAQEIADLKFMRQEEKLAYDLYNYFYSLWGSSIFSSIAQSEQQHMQAVLNQLDRLGLQDPVFGLAPGVFADPALQSLYDTLEARGIWSEAGALAAAVDVELTDIEDLELALTHTSDSAIRRVYQNLTKGSQNHLAAFSARLEALGGNPPDNGLNPGVSIYEPVSRTLYIPAINVTDSAGGVKVYDALLRMVETLPQALELVSATATTKTPSSIHAGYDVRTGIVTIPQLQVGAIALGALEDNVYSAELELIPGSTSPLLFSIKSLVLLP